MKQRPVLIDADDLAARLASSRPPRLLDVRWRLGDDQGRQHYLDGHLPGAVYVDLETELARPGTPADGRHPLPDEAAFQAAARRWGIRTGDAVVVYDDAGATSAARAWWLLRHGGVADVRILDGGLGAWQAAGHRLETGAVEVDPGDVTLTFGHRATVTDDEAAAAGRQRVLLDARAGERYRGEVEPADPKAGQIPGAISLPTTDLLDADGRFRTPEAIRARLRRAVGASITDENRVVAYCGSGVNATHEIAALATAGIDAILYPGSFSAWANQDRPVATGSDPG